MSNSQERGGRIAAFTELIEGRADVARLLSKSAAVAGALSLVVSAITWKVQMLSLRPAWFSLLWIALAGLVMVVLISFAASQAREHARDLLSPGFRLAASIVSGPLIAWALIVVVGIKAGHPPILIATYSALFYGLVLLAGSFVAPKSLAILGWCFLVAAASMFGLLVISISCGRAYFLQVPPGLFMGLTFGLFHLIYATTTRRTGSK